MITILYETLKCSVLLLVGYNFKSNNVEMPELGVCYEESLFCPQKYLISVSYANKL